MTMTPKIPASKFRGSGKSMVMDERSSGWVEEMTDREIDAATGWPADELRRALQPKYWGWIDNIWRVDEDIRDIPGFRDEPVDGMSDAPELETDFRLAQRTMMDRCVYVLRRACPQLGLTSDDDAAEVVRCVIETTFEPTKAMMDGGAAAAATGPYLARAAWQKMVEIIVAPLHASRKLREIERDLVADRLPNTLADAFAEASRKSLPRQIALARQNTK